MARPVGSKTVYFSKVKEAREALAKRALEVFELQMKIAQDALAAQNFTEANKAVQFLLEHMPKDEEGITLLDSSVDNVKETKGSSGPTIQIGIALGPKREPKELAPSSPIEIIDVT